MFVMILQTFLALHVLKFEDEMGRQFVNTFGLYFSVLPYKFEEEMGGQFVNTCGRFVPSSGYVGHWRPRCSLVE